MIGVAILGCGVVGSGTVKMLMENRERINRAAGVEVVLKAILDKRPVEAPRGVLVTNNFDDILNDPEIGIIAEAMGGVGDAYDYTKRALEAGKSIITSNKELVSAHGDELEEIGSRMGVRYLYEGAAGGAIPIIRPINLCLGGNHFQQITGIVNGSTNYLLTRMEEQGISFPTALDEAKRLGYVEADPSADVEGHDARRKIAILAHEAFASRFDDHSKVPCEGISRVTQEDIRAAELFEGRIKLIARACMQGETWTGSVRPCFVPRGHSLYNIRDVFNAVQIHTDFAGETTIAGRGAGSMPTASAIVGDIIDAAKNPAAYPKGDFVPKFKEEKLVSRFVVRVDGSIPPELTGCELRRMSGVLAIRTSMMAEDELRWMLSDT
ncbi:MAG: homoserine dehydrogenase, partial [Clostridia bacterium]|nr:homoserine dehydrogenase [Clostridia bacterium]